MNDPILPRHGGYRKLVSYQVAKLIEDVTVRFCDQYVDKQSRTHDQMVQAARSGVQNIVEGSVVSGTSRKSEIYLTGIANGSWEELRADYEDHLRHRGLPMWDWGDPRRTDLIARRCTSAADFAAWVKDTHGRHGEYGQRDNDDSGVSMLSMSSMRRATQREIAANGALALIAVVRSLLDRQVEAQAKAFEKEGGLTEMLYRKRTEYRRKHKD